MAAAAPCLSLLCFPVLHRKWKGDNSFRHRARGGGQRGGEGIRGEEREERRCKAEDWGC